MGNQADEELGPIDWVVIAFPQGESHFDGAMAKELAALAEAELIRILDLVILTMTDDGELDVLEVEDLDDLGALGALEGNLAEIIAQADVEAAAEVMEPGDTVGLLVWENTWAAPFAVAARKSGGQLIDSGRIPTQAFLAAVGAESEGA